MGQFQITNMGDFDPREQTHIMILMNRAQKIQGYKNRGGKIDVRLQKELDALVWVFNVLNEISEED